MALPSADEAEPITLGAAHLEIQTLDSRVPYLAAEHHRVDQPRPRAKPLDASSPRPRLDFQLASARHAEGLPHLAGRNRHLPPARRGRSAWAARAGEVREIAPERRKALFGVATARGVKVGLDR